MLCRRCLADGGLRACRHCELETELVSIRGGWRFLREPQPGVIGQALLGGFLDLPGDRCPDHRGTG